MIPRKLFIMMMRFAIPRGDCGLLYSREIVGLFEFLTYFESLLVESLEIVGGKLVGGEFRHCGTLRVLDTFLGVVMELLKARWSRIIF